MANKYIGIVSGVQTQIEGVASSAGAGDAGKIVALSTDGKLDQSVMPTGVGADVKVLAAFENLSAGNLVHFKMDTGTLKAYKADASNGRPADGFVKDAVTADNDATIHLEGTITGLSGLTPGARYYLGTNGTVTAVPTTTASHYHQYIGRASSDTEVAFEANDYIVLV